MISDSIQDSTRYIVSNVHHGSILPGNRMEMFRDVFLLTNAEIRGGIYSHNLLVEGSNITVDKSVFSAKSIIIKEVKPDIKLTGNRFNSTVVATDSILIENKVIKTKFKSDIYTNKLNISNTIVYGNIYSENAIIDNCIVLGGIFCSERLRISNSIYSTFRADSVNLGTNLYQLYPIALSRNQILMKNPIKAITFLNIYDSVSKNTDSGIIVLDQDDIFEVDEHYPSGNGSKNNNDINNKLYCLSIAERILNTEKIIEHFRFNKVFLESLALESHLRNVDKNSDLLHPSGELDNYLWSILSGRDPLSEIKGSEEIETLFRRIKGKYS